jgi:hypothetical protein
MLEERQASILAKAVEMLLEGSSGVKSVLIKSFANKGISFI